jgi:hypothetical protein
MSRAELIDVSVIYPLVEIERTRIDNGMKTPRGMMNLESQKRNRYRETSDNEEGGEKVIRIEK